MGQTAVEDRVFHISEAPPGAEHIGRIRRLGNNGYFGNSFKLNSRESREVNAGALPGVVVEEAEHGRGMPTESAGGLELTALADGIARPETLILSVVYGYHPCAS